MTRYNLQKKKKRLRKHLENLLQCKPDFSHKSLKAQSSYSVLLLWSNLKTFLLGADLPTSRILPHWSSAGLRSSRAHGWRLYILTAVLSAHTSCSSTQLTAPTHPWGAPDGQSVTPTSQDPDCPLLLSLMLNPKHLSYSTTSLLLLRLFILPKSCFFF